MTAAPTSLAAAATGRDRRVSLNGRWEIRSSAGLSTDGAALSTPGFAGPGWLPTTVPATVLGAEVDAGVHGDDIFRGDNFLRIPGQGPRAQNFSNFEMPGDSPYAVSWWYRREFEVGAEVGDHVTLALDGINYRANVWLNGQLVADRDTVVGAYRTFDLEVTERLWRGGPNALAIEVFAPRPCDLAITWVDWNPSPPDKNMGLWRDVWLRHSGAVSLRAPHVITRLDGGRAYLTVGGDVVNRREVTQAVTVVAKLEHATVRKRVTVGPRARLRFDITSEDDGALILEDPRLWWPRFLGGQPLYDLDVLVETAEGVSDDAHLQFGVREVTAGRTAEGHARIAINGQEIQVRGAGWASDLFLRRRPDQDLAQLEYVKALNLNTIRFEGMLERADFLEWCDREGILVIAGWCCCDQWEKWPEWKDENHAVATASLGSQIRRVRRHPCMIAWWYGSDQPPPAPVEQRYLDVLAEERWPNPCHSSASATPAELTGPSGLKMNGPYDYVPPTYWLEDTARGGAFGFATEISPGPAVPPVESLRRMIPEEHLWPVDDMWCFHAGGQSFRDIDRFRAALAGRYGPVDGVETFAGLAQLANYESQRAMFEGYARRKGTATGVIQWMLNNAWPSLIWNLFDHYLRPGGGFFGVQRACEPLHVQYTPGDRTVVVVNEHRDARVGLRVQARAFGLDLEELFAGSAPVEVGGSALTEAFGVPAFDRDAPWFLDLRLYDEMGGEVGRNFYWLPGRNDELDHAAGTWFHTPISRYADLRAVRELPAATVGVSAERDGPAVAVELTNGGTSLAFFIQLRLTDGGGQDLLPVLWDDNYVSLLPGETRPLRASVPGGQVPVGARVEVSGINVPTATVALADRPPTPGAARRS